MELIKALQWRLQLPLPLPLSMKRKKWTEEEESTLLSEYSSLRSSGALARLRTREKKFQPIADRVNAAHHLVDPSSFPFLWSWRDVSVKIQNMRHQFINVKLKIQSSPSSFDWDHGLQLWPNLLCYRDVFGDVDLENPSTVPSDGDDIEIDADGKGSEGQLVRKGKRKWRKVRIVATRVAEIGEIAVRRREREAAAEDEEERWLRRLEDREEEERERRRRRWEEEERREEEEMEWRERLLGMQMAHEKQVMQMHADACQAQMQVLGILVRVICQILGPGGGGGDGGGMAGMTSQVLHGLQQTQQSPDSLVGDADGKDGAHSAAHYL